MLQGSAQRTYKWYRWVDATARRSESTWSPIVNPAIISSRSAFDRRAYSTLSFSTAGSPSPPYSTPLSRSVIIASDCPPMVLIEETREPAETEDAPVEDPGC